MLCILLVQEQCVVLSSMKVQDGSIASAEVALPLPGRLRLGVAEPLDQVLAFFHLFIGLPALQDLLHSVLGLAVQGRRMEVVTGDHLRVFTTGQIDHFEDLALTRVVANETRHDEVGCLITEDDLEL